MTGTPHIEAAKGDFAETVLMPGDPLRAQALAKNHLDDVLLVAGGTFPVEDIPTLEEMGVHKVFRAGSLTDTIVQYIRQNVKR